MLRRATLLGSLSLLLTVGVSVAVFAQEPTPPPKQEPKKPKKVWTNEDVSSLKQKGGVSVVGQESTEPKAQSKPEEKKPGTKASPPWVDPFEKVRRENSIKQAEELKKQQEELRKAGQETLKRMEEQKKKPPSLPSTQRP